MNFKDAPIRHKLMMVIMATSTIVLCLTAAAFITFQVVAFRKSLVESSQTIGQITAAESGNAVYFEDERSCREILSKLETEPSITRAALYGRAGKFLGLYPGAASTNGCPPVRWNREFVLHLKSLDVFVPVQYEGKVVGALYLRWDLSPAYARLRWMVGMAAVVLAGSLAIGWIISNWLQRRISRPILELSNTAAQVTHSRDYSLRAKTFGRDELGQFANTFNQMLEQIARQDEALRLNEDKLRQALQDAQVAAEEVRTLNAELEDRVVRRTAELAASNQELEAFAYSVSHDLRAPLRHVDAFAQILGEELQGDPAKLRHYVKNIRQGAQNMGRLVDDLLNLSRIGQAKPKSEQVDLNAVVQEVLQELSMETKEREIEWKITGLPPVTGDGGLIKQIFANLIGNSIKYTRPRAKAVIEIGMEPIGREPAIFVRDNGVGFNMKFSAKLFGVFQRLHHADEFEGTGVGLATVQRIVHLHGGKIWANAELDKGASFHFTLAGLERPAR